MPSSRSTSAARSATARSERTAPRRPATPRPRRVPLRDQMVRLRWERLGRIALLVVLAAVVALYAEHAVSYLSTRAQNDRAQATVQQLERQNRGLEAQRRALGEPGTIISLARGLGMIRSGEQPYDITGKGR